MNFWSRTSSKTFNRYSEFHSSNEAIIRQLPTIVVTCDIYIPDFHYSFVYLFNVLFKMSQTILFFFCQSISGIHVNQDVHNQNIYSVHCIKQYKRIEEVNTLSLILQLVTSY